MTLQAAMLVCDGDKQDIPLGWRVGLLKILLLLEGC